MPQIETERINVDRTAVKKLDPRPRARSLNLPLPLPADQRIRERSIFPGFQNAFCLLLCDNVGSRFVNNKIAQLFQTPDQGRLSRTGRPCENIASHQVLLASRLS